MLPDLRVRQRDYLLELSRALTRELNLDKLLERILEISMELLVGQAGFIALPSYVGGWRIQVSKGLSPAFLQHIGKYLSEIPMDDVPEQGESSNLNQWLTNLVRSLSSGSLAGVGLPLVSQRQVTGFIFIFRQGLNLFTQNDRMLLGSFADQAAIAVGNAKLYTQVNQEKQRLDALLETSGDGILILFPDLKIERANPALLRLLSLSRQEVIGNLHEQIIRWEKVPKDDTLEKAVSGGWPLTPHAILYVEGDLKRNGDLKPLPVSITYAPLISSTGTLVNIIANIRDITRFRQTEELKSTFVSIIGHELKTPVALIKGYVSTLRLEDAHWDKDIVAESLQVIEDEADHLGNLIDNLLEASRLQAGGFSIKRTECSMPALSERAAKKFQTQTAHHQITVDFDQDFPLVHCDEFRIEQVLANLISNSIKYSPQGKIVISGQSRADSIIICVSDEGPGIDPEDLPYVFDRFYRSPEIAKKSKGTGLGLYLAKSIIEAHGGKIWIDKPRKIGAHICFSLPR